jgi:hypothetical protein
MGYPAWGMEPIRYACFDPGREPRTESKGTWTWTGYIFSLLLFILLFIIFSTTSSDLLFITKKIT